MNCSSLRRSLRANIVTFPSPIPVLLKDFDPDHQWRMVSLYFIRGWGVDSIAGRMRIPTHQVWRRLNEWTRCALREGYVQVIDPEAFAACSRGTPGEDHANGNGEPAGWKGDSPGSPSNPSLIGAELAITLEAAIAHCEEWRGEFLGRLTSVLQDLKTAAASATGAPEPVRNHHRNGNGNGKARL